MNEENRNREARRDQALRSEFTDTQLKGARWDLPGWTEANERLDNAGLKTVPDITVMIAAPETPKVG